MWVFVPIKDKNKPVVFDVGFILRDDLCVVRQFDSRTDAEDYVHYLNGGVPSTVERTLESVCGVMLRAELR